MKRYFNNPSIIRVLNTSRIVFPINKNNFITPCSLYIKVLPNLNDGI